MAEAVFAGAKEGDLFGLIERIIDMRPFMEPMSERANPRFFKSYNFHYNESVETPDELPSPGQSWGRRRGWRRSASPARDSSSSCTRWSHTSSRSRR